MPELPEVETIRRGLDQKIVGLSIVSVEVRAKKLLWGDVNLILNQKIISISRRGKLLIVEMNNKMYLTVHLKMTGQLIWQKKRGSLQNQVIGGHPERAYALPHPHKHTHIIFYLSDDSVLYYNDLRKFGLLKILSFAQLKDESFLNKLGPEPLSKEFSFEYLRLKIKTRSKSLIKVFLLDQENIAGLGNIYVDESLFEAGILPNRQNNSLNDGEIELLFNSINKIIKKAIDLGGSTARDYLNIEGGKGVFLDYANVYRRTGQICNRCNKTKIERMKVGGRSSHYCLACQK